LEKTFLCGTAGAVFVWVDCAALQKRTGAVLVDFYERMLMNSRFNVVVLNAPLTPLQTHYGRIARTAARAPAAAAYAQTIKKGGSKNVVTPQPSCVV
jgi:hypothetical protein